MIEQMNYSQKEIIGKTGLVIGKFYPPHKGHDYLINTAKQKSEIVDVIVVDREDQKIRGDLRAKWLMENHKNVNIITRPQELPDFDSERWAEQTLYWLGYRPDTVFTSENYGFNYAKYLKSAHYLVDYDRNAVPISGTKVRNNPLENLDFLEPNIREYFVKRICVLGAESTGTTTLSKALARFYQTLWVPEYGREYSENKIIENDYSWQSDEFETIAQKQQEMENNLARYANKILICDTNAFATEIWHERYMGKMSENVGKIGQNAKADLYIVTDIDIPFVQDGTRDGQHIREWMHKRFIDELSNRNLPFIVVSGNHKNRMKEAKSAINYVIKKDIFL